MINRGTNTQEHWEKKHNVEYNLDQPFDFTEFNNGEDGYHSTAAKILSEKKDSIKNKSILEIGCAGGNFSAYIKEYVLPDFEIEAWDFSQTGIDAAKRRCNKVKYEQRDFLTDPVNSNYGVICIFETLEHVAEGDNYVALDNMLEHSEYVLISVPNTPDSCWGEHISHYSYDEFEDNGYNVIQKLRLDTIDMSESGLYGDYFHFMVLIKGKL